MPKIISNQLTIRTVERLKNKGFYLDGFGLYLKIDEAKGDGLPPKSWIFRYRERGNGKTHDIGLGSSYSVTLAQAREKAGEMRRQIAAGIDPMKARDEAREKERAERAKAITFQQCAEEYIESQKAGWKNAKHAAQWTSTLATYAFPIIGKKPVADIDIEHVKAILEPIWSTKPETASRVRGRVESVLAYAAVNRLRSVDNPATWRGFLEKSGLPSKASIAPVKHHAALHYAEMPAFISELRTMEGVGAKALEFSILCASRTGEVIGANWSEIDIAGRMWTIPGERMKASREHRVPLGERSLAILEWSAGFGKTGFVFPGAKLTKGLSNMSLAAVLKRMDREDLTVHGFRSSFRDWAADCTSFPREIAEASLAHTLKDKTEAAYRRSDLFEKRRALMKEWSTFLEG